MHLWAIAGGALSAAIWLYLLLFRGRFWLPPQPPAPAEAP